jgi:dihydroflavonol-4-reductase
MTQVLITGGTGFIGSRLALRCLEAGEAVRVLARRNTPAEARNAQDLADRGAEFIDASVTDPETPARACQGVDTIYHLAAAQHEANVPDRYFREVNVEGTRRMLDAAVEAGVPRFVHASSIGVFGIGRDGPVTEQAPLDPDNVYGVTKLEGEEVARSYADRMAVPIVRISEAYGPGDRRLLKLFRAVESGRLFRIGSGRNLHHPVYIDDLVDGLRGAARSPKAAGRSFVLAGPSALTTDAMIDAVARALDRRPPRLRVPLWPLMAGAVVLETALGPLGIQPPLHRRRMNFFVKSFQFDGSGAGDALGFEPEVEFPEGAARTAAWYREEGLL